MAGAQEKEDGLWLLKEQVSISSQSPVIKNHTSK